MKITVQDNNTVDRIKVNFLGLELEKAHADYMSRKEDSITKLYNIWRNTDIPAIYREWVRDAARLLNESDMR